MLWNGIWKTVYHRSAQQRRYVFRSHYISNGRSFHWNINFEYGEKGPPNTVYCFYVLGVPQLVCQLSYSTRKCEYQSASPHFHAVLRIGINDQKMLNKRVIIITRLQIPSLFTESISGGLWSYLTYGALIQHHQWHYDTERL